MFSAVHFQNYKGTRDNTLSIRYTAAYRQEFGDNRCDEAINDEDSDDDDDSQPLTIDDDVDESEEDDLDQSCPKYLIFSTGCKTYTPHQIGFKCIRNVNFPKKMEPGPSLKERIAKERERALQVQVYIGFWFLLSAQFGGLNCVCVCVFRTD